MQECLENITVGIDNKLYKMHGMYIIIIIIINFIIITKMKQKNYCYEGSQAMSARPCGKGRLVASSNIGK